MNTESIRLGVNARIEEARLLLQFIRAAEIARPTTGTLSPLASMLRGIFYVQVYGALEYCVTQGCQQFIGYAATLNIHHCHLEPRFNAVALDAEIMSLHSKKSKDWKARIKLFERLSSANHSNANDTVFGSFLFNIWPATIEEIFQCFSIDQAVTAEPRQLGYLKELVEKRNAVAHGRETSSDAGEGKSGEDLDRLMNAVYGVCFYFLTTLETHASNRGIIKEAFRTDYPMEIPP